MTSPNTNSPKIETDLTAEPLRALWRGLTRANGFSLYIAVVKTPAQRKQLIDLLQDAIPTTRLQTVTIRSDTTDILDEITKQLGNQMTGPIMVVGLDEAISTEAANHPILHSLNLRRPDWPQLVRQPVVFWVPEYLLGIIGHAAPDFLDWRSDTLHFPDVEPAQLQMFDSATWDSGLDTRMPVAARMERIKELESRIATSEHSRDKAVLSAVTLWLNELGLHLNFLGRMPQSYGHYQKAIAICRMIQDRRGECAILGNLGNAHMLLGDLTKAVEFYQQALTISQETDDKRVEATVLGNLGVISGSQGDARKAVSLHAQQLGIARQVGDRRNEGNAIEGLAVAYMDLGDIHKSTQFHEQALLIFRELGDRRNEGAVLGNLGINYKRLGDPAKAIEFYTQLLGIAREIGNRHDEGSALDNLGTAYGMAGNVTKAIEFYEQHLKIAREIGDRRGEGYALGNLGSAHANVGLAAKALGLFGEAAKIIREIGDRRGEAHILWNSAVAFEKLNDRPKAITYGEAAVKLFESIQDSRANLIREYIAKWRAATPPNISVAEAFKK